MSDKKRFFYVVSSLGDNSQTTISAVCRIDGTIFNCNELRQQVANESLTHIGNVYIKSWHEFANEQDYKDFFK